MANNFDLGDILITSMHRRPAGMNPSYAKRVEEIVFTAYYLGKNIGHVTVDRCQSLGVEEMHDEFYAEQDYDPPRPIPWVFYLKVDNGFKRQGIATHMLLMANEFYRREHDICLCSSICNPEPNDNNCNFGSLPVWESLVRKGLAEEIGYRSNRRWRLL